MVEIYGKISERWTGRAIPKALVYVQETKEAAETDAQGKFVLRSVERGHVHLSCSADEHTPRVIEVDVDDGPEVSRVSVELSPVVRTLG